MPLSRCQDVIDRISQIVDGEAGPALKVRFFAHLAICSNCTRYYRQLRDVRAAAGAAAPEDLPADFDAVMQRVLDAIDE